MSLDVASCRQHGIIHKEAMPQDRSDKIKVFEVQDRTTVILLIAEVIRPLEEVLLHPGITVPRLEIDPTVLLADLVVGLPVPVVQAEDNKKKKHPI